MEKISHVYILIDCAKNEPFYVGMSDNVKSRIKTHFNGKANKSGLLGTKLCRRIIKSGGSVIALIAYAGNRRDALYQEKRFTLMMQSSGILLENRKARNLLPIYEPVKSKNDIMLSDLVEIKPNRKENPSKNLKLKIAERVNDFMDRINASRECINPYEKNKTSRMKYYEVIRQKYKLAS